MDKKVPENILRVSGLGTLQGILQSKKIDLIKQVQQLAAAKERERELKAYCKNTEDKLNAKEYTLLESAHDHLRKRYAVARERITELESELKVAKDGIARLEERLIKFNQLGKLETAARRLVDNAKNSKQELWASLPDVLAVEEALSPIPSPTTTTTADKWCLYQDNCRHSSTGNQSDSECNSCVTHCNFEWKEG